MNGLPKRDLPNELNRMSPAASNAQLGTVVADLVDKHNALCAKLDADAGVTSTDYVATLSVVNLGGKR